MLINNGGLTDVELYYDREPPFLEGDLVTSGVYFDAPVDPSGSMFWVDLILRPLACSHCVGLLELHLVIAGADSIDLSKEESAALLQRLCDCALHNPQ